ncbi:hypothetical protein [Verrucomicrobium sp. BvORR034]|uniref:hypothetical protein n=1 Tax=Verrucomicrobium sp. BvORR034 TaxID=1396418 RepID=UPI000679A874|nr:hypothetical protein [Verrucomicrobium sp. BvORR034]
METKKPARQKARRRESGAALIMTLFIVGVLTILVVGFLSTMQTERQAAGAYESSQRTKLVAQGAVSHAIELLRNNIPDPARLSEGPAQAPAENWVTNPGRLTLIRPGQPVRYVPLHTGEVTVQPPTGVLRDAESVNLNKPLPGSTTPAIVPAATGSTTPPEMRVKWVNLLRDPSAAAGPENRLSARYAFWLDDETARLNFNTAIGKPAPGTDNRFTKQLEGGFMPPIFLRGGDDTTSGDGKRTWGLGKPQSVNLDVLFSDPTKLMHDKLLAQTFLNGFARFPEAIMDYADVADPKAWYEENKFNLTFYNRSPEFNAFGRSRLFTSYIPLSLEAGPSYQLPFIYDPSSTNGAITPKGVEGTLEEGTLASGQLKDDQILNLNSLMGFFGVNGADIAGPEGYLADKANMVNRNQIRMLMDYFGRKWPGYDRSFLDKYGYLGSYQIALNILQQARMATTQLDGGVADFSTAYAARSTSVNFFPNSGELAGAAPERFYWRVKDPDTNKVVLMLPQTPGPHITELRLFVQATNPDPAPKNNAPTTESSRYIKYWYEVEYYMQPFGPIVDLKEFPTRMDYFEITAKGGGKNPSQQFGATTAEDPRNDRQWHNKFMNLLATYPAANTLIGPKGAKLEGTAVPNRVVVKSPEFAIGKFQRVDNDNPPTNKSDAPARKDDKITDLTPAQLTNIWDPVIFDSSVNAGTAKVSIRWRPGQGTLGNENRPRQMIPLGLTPDDTLKVDLTVDLKDVGTPKVVSWQIADPNLSSDAAQWVMTGPGKENKIGTPGKINAGEPAEDSSEKSKFRSIQRAPDGAKISGYNYDRPDEYVTTSRVSSPGYWSLLHTGMQSKTPWRTLSLDKADPSEGPPDWLLLDLFGATYPMAHDQWKIDKKLPDSFSTASYMGSTAGQVNLNSRIYPRNDHFNIPDRHLPLEAVFKYLRSDSDVTSLVDNITSYQTDSQVFDYVGELAEVPGYDGGNTSAWARESLLRNMAGVLTTRSNTFGMWGVAQVLQKSSRNIQHDVYEAGDRVVGEKRFYALIERYVWTGRDGVPGNGHLSNVGTWDRTAQQTARLSTADGMTDTLFQLPGSPPLKRSGDGDRLDLDAAGRYPKFDGPEPVGMDVYTASALGSVEYTSSSLEDAYNPPQAAIKYRVVYFKYLDE